MENCDDLRKIARTCQTHKLEAILITLKLRMQNSTIAMSICHADRYILYKVNISEYSLNRV